MSQSIHTRWLAVLIVLGILLGVTGGGIVGGLAGFYVAGTRAQVPAPAVGAELASVKTTSQPQITSKFSVMQDSAIVDTVKKAEPAVVTVITTLGSNSNQSSGGPQNPFGPSGPTNPLGPNPQGLGANVAEGSGVIVDDQGHIVTNAHVVDGATKIEVVLNDGTKMTANLVGADSVSDIAVLKVGGKVPGFLSLGDSSTLQLGETAIAIGSPLGNYRGSVTVGVISGLNRSVDGTGQENLIQTDAAINHGNSGGPLLNAAGQIVGINTLVVRDATAGDPAQGLGFAVPSSTVVGVVQQLLAQGSVQYPYIGIQYGSITPAGASVHSLPVQQGALVEAVSPGSPANNAGIQPQDIITAVDQKPLDENHPLRSILFQYHSGDKVTFTILRNGQTLSLAVTLGTRPAQPSTTQPG